MAQLHAHFQQVPLEARLITLSAQCRTLYNSMLEEAGRCQEALMYTCEHATGEMGKLPEVALRNAVLSWCVSFLAGAPDAVLNTERDDTNNVVRASVELQAHRQADQRPTVLCF